MKAQAFYPLMHLPGIQDVEKSHEEIGNPIFRGKQAKEPHKFLGYCCPAMSMSSTESGFAHIETRIQNCIRKCFLLAF